MMVCSGPFTAQLPMLSSPEGKPFTLRQEPQLVKALSPIVLRPDPKTTSSSPVQ